MNKYLFIDESGDPGINVENGSSKYFVMAAVVFDDILEMESLSVEIKKLARKLFKDDYHEFHFVHERNIHRLEFFKLVSSYNFKILVSDSDKSNLSRSKDNLYRMSLYDICNNLKDDKSICNFKFDGSVSKSYKFGVERELRVFSKNRFRLGKVKFANSKSDSLIQLSDMCAGLIRKKLENEDAGIADMYSCVRSKIQYR